MAGEVLVAEVAKTLAHEVEQIGELLELVVTKRALVEGGGMDHLARSFLAKR
jgi:hypothetical protein